MHIKAITIDAFFKDGEHTNTFVSAFIFRGVKREGKHYNNITPSSLRRLMSWQAAAYLANRKVTL